MKKKTNKWIFVVAALGIVVVGAPLLGMVKGPVKEYDESKVVRETVETSYTFTGTIDGDKNVTMKVSEYDMKNVADGKEVTVHIPALDKGIEGKIEEVADKATVQNGVAFFTAKVTIPDEKDFKVGMTAEIEMVNEKRENTLTIPMKMLQFDDREKPYVLVEGKDGKEKKQYVKVGINDGIVVEITEGLAKNDVVWFPKPSTQGNAFLPPMPPGM